MARISHADLPTSRVPSSSTPTMLYLISLLLPLVLVVGACTGGGEEATSDGAAEVEQTEPPVELLRVAVFNVLELGRDKLDQTGPDGRGSHPQLVSAAEILQRVRPDILLLNEIDYDPGDGKPSAVDLFQERYLGVGQGGQRPLEYPHVFYQPVNTGVPSGYDLDGDGKIGGPGDALGWGEYPGQYGMAVLSRFPLGRFPLEGFPEEGVRPRTFRDFPWQAMPGHLMPDGREGRPEYYDPEIAPELPLSSKSHWDVPVLVDGEVLHLLASHPTPPVFDGPEDRNGRRNFDEIRLWADYLTGGEAASYLVDDEGRAGGLAPDARFVILGDLNADPHFEPVTYPGRDGEPTTAIGQLLEHPRVQDPHPSGPGAHAGDRDYPGPEEEVTSEFGLRVDYVLPSAQLEVLDAGVFWPPPDDPLHRLVAGEAAASDHRLVWVDLAWPPGGAGDGSGGGESTRGESSGEGSGS